MRLKRKEKGALEFIVVIKEFKIKHEWEKSASRDQAATSL